MLLTFSGTRGNLTIFSARHRRHSALQVEFDGGRLLIDCGRDWREQLPRPTPDQVLLTHAHDDHAGGLSLPLPVEVYAVPATWRVLPDLATDPRARRCREGCPLRFGALQATPVPLPHSHRAPAVGWLLESAHLRVFYAPDCAGPPAERLPDLDLYIGDGSSFSTDLLRIEEGASCGHAPIASQLEWCREAGVAEIIFTHCGTEILADEDGSAERLAALAESFAMSARFAEDGLQLRPGAIRRGNPAGRG